MQLYHGSDTSIQRPDVSFNTGFADMGTGFYLTDDFNVAASRARSRARKTGAACGIVSVHTPEEESPYTYCKSPKQKAA